MATATIQRGQLLVSESTGERIAFRREPRYDSADGRLLGYLSVPLQRVLRFPRTGFGVMQVADLDDPNPQFRQTLRSVRPSEVDPLFGYQPSGVVPFGRAGAPWGSYPYVSGYRAPLPQSILIDSKTTAHAPLPPAKLTLVNGGPREILLTLVDSKADQPKELRLRPAQRIQVEVQRDAGRDEFNATKQSAPPVRRSRRK